MSAFSDRVGRLPWVTRLPETVPCDTYRYGHMPGKALWGSKGQAATPELKEKYRCRNRARWQYRGLPDPAFPPHDDGTFCWPHLMSRLYATPAEEARMKRELRRLREQEEREAGLS